MNLESLKLLSSTTLSDVIRKIDANGEGFVCIVDKDDKLLGTVTDGDIRRAIINGLVLTEVCTNIMNTSPKVKKLGIENEEALNYLQETELRNLPIVDDQGKLIKVLHLKDLVKINRSSCTAVILAGGEGKRLRPYTDSIPKPMLEIQGKPMLEHIVHRLKLFNITKIYISVNYLSNIIEDHFGDGSTFGVQIEYLRETKKLGTAGPLALLPEDTSGPLLVMNGDIVTQTNFKSMVNYHKDHSSDITVGASVYNIKVPYGVLKLEGENVVGLQEKPTKSFFCSAGLYVLSKNVLGLIPRDSFFDIPDLIDQLISQNFKVKAFPIHEQWKDIGRKEDLMAIRTEKL